MARPELKGPSRICIICGKEKPISKFHRKWKDKNPNRFQSRCKDCNWEVLKQYRIKKEKRK